GMRGKQVEHRAQKKVEGRRLLLQIKNASPEIVPQQRGIDVLPIEDERLGVEPDSGGEAQQARRNERSGEERPTGSGGRHSPVYRWFLVDWRRKYRYGASYASTRDPHSRQTLIPDHRRDRRVGALHWRSHRFTDSIRSTHLGFAGDSGKRRS